MRVCADWVRFAVEMENQMAEVPALPEVLELRERVEEVIPKVNRVKTRLAWLVQRRETANVRYAVVRKD